MADARRSELVEADAIFARLATRVNHLVGEVVAIHDEEYRAADALWSLAEDLEPEDESARERLRDNLFDSLPGWGRLTDAWMELSSAVDS